MPKPINLCVIQDHNSNELIIIDETKGFKVLARILCDEKLGHKDPKALFTARVFVNAFKMFDELEILVLSHKKNYLQYWSPKEARKIVKEIREG